jgi:hypothetical protein
VTAARLFRFQVFQANAASCPQALPRLLDPAQKARIVFEAMFKPIVVGFQADPANFASHDNQKKCPS